MRRPRSCEPNLEAKPVASASGDPRLRRIGFYALREIHEGEELGYRRDKNAWSQRKRDKSIPCRCGAPADKCMKFV